MGFILFAIIFIVIPILELLPQKVGFGLTVVIAIVLGFADGLVQARFYFSYFMNKT